MKLEDAERLADLLIKNDRLFEERQAMNKTHSFYKVYTEARKVMNDNILEILTSHANQ